MSELLAIYGMNPFTNEVDSMPIDLLQSPYALKGKASSDPDTPPPREALTGNDAKCYRRAMDREIECLQKMNTWEVCCR